MNDIWFYKNGKILNADIQKEDVDIKVIVFKDKTVLVENKGVLFYSQRYYYPEGFFELEQRESYVEKPVAAEFYYIGSDKDYHYFFKDKTLLCITKNMYFVYPLNLKRALGRYYFVLPHTLVVAVKTREGDFFVSNYCIYQGYDCVERFDQCINCRLVAYLLKKYGLSRTISCMKKGLALRKVITRIKRIRLEILEDNIGYYGKYDTVIKAIEEFDESSIDPMYLMYPRLAVPVINFLKAYQYAKSNNLDLYPDCENISIRVGSECIEIDSVIKSRLVYTDRGSRLCKAYCDPIPDIRRFSLSSRRFSKKAIKVWARFIKSVGKVEFENDVRALIS